MYDVAIIGAGFSGAVCAERFASLGRKVLVVEKRFHVGGNAYDTFHPSGVLIHPYGPHIFHTNSESVISYLSQFTEWRPYQHRVLTSVDGQLVPFPINLRTIENVYGLKLTSDEMKAWIANQAEPILNPINVEQSMHARIGKDLYQRFFKHYTEKQWGRPATELLPTITNRIPLRYSYDDRYFTDRYQLMPLYGYSALFRNMLNRPNISILLNTDWASVKDLKIPKIICTGPIDEYFDYVHGHLPYRSLHFDFIEHPVDFAQPVATVNYPNDYDFTRITEFKHITGQRIPHITVTGVEYPQESGEPFYPVLTKESQRTLEHYQEEAKRIESHVQFVGRLGTFRYYNMDQAVASALQTVDECLNSGW
ncbi:UDP-galactopyranose mutase [Sulfobacillus harzensis]|uniref:UDP-galactopyranose mutase n=1 Tax=Sulfobacillus harzensis TaxID=2729629 RepID=A0A7Y0Q4S6_9FIRM|nr:UDP-galactopyranose mutase [Sulfobacillus harzensis]NMP24346.1 UDP-galactopyranose mutase [Sulfobacillus harzensis]